MKGVIAGGSEPTVRAGAEVLERGGNAIDAAVAACFATAVGEPTLTSLAGSGVMIYRPANSDEAFVCDFFSDAPRLGPAEVDELDFYDVELDFGPTTQRFFIGAGSCSVPGAIPGLCTALELWGSMDLGDVVAPACRMLREGMTLKAYQGFAAKLLEPILTRTPAARAIFAPAGHIVGEGDRFALPALADTLESLAAYGWRTHYEQVLVSAMLGQFGPAHGGLLTPGDFTDYQVRLRRPLSLRYRDQSVQTMPPPAAGGPMIALMLQLLEGVDCRDLEHGGAAHARLLCQTMALADEARAEGVAALEPDRLNHWRRRLDDLRQRGLLTAPAGAGGPGSTTHVSVIDAAGNTAGVTVSYGEGNGHMIGSSGIMMNNLMGEEDLHPGGFGSAAGGERLPTMMSPTLLLGDDGAVTMLGTGGANRIRTAIVQVITALTDFGRSPADATTASRIHYEDGVLNAEIFDRPDGGAALSELGAERLVRFDAPNLFFGGVHLVKRSATGQLDGAGDPRRGGVCRVV